jgi:hypothetical protein
MIRDCLRMLEVFCSRFLPQVLACDWNEPMDMYSAARVEFRAADCPEKQTVLQGQHEVLSEDLERRFFLAASNDDNLALALSIARRRCASWLLAARCQCSHKEVIYYRPDESDFRPREACWMTRTRVQVLGRDL